MKKMLVSVALSSSLLFGGGIPVIDAVANAQAMAQNVKTIAEWAKEAERWVNTVNHYQSQLDAYKNQLLSATEIRNSVQFIKDLESFHNFAKNYKDDYLSLTNDILNSNSPIGIKAKELFNRYNIYDDCENTYFSSQEKNICKNKMTRRVQEVATYQQYSSTLSDLGNDLSDLSYKLANSTDIKESQDINNAIQLKVAQLELTKTQVQLMQEQNKGLDLIEEKQKAQLVKQRLNNEDTRDYSNIFNN